MINELFIRARKSNIFLVFITQFILIAIIFIMKIPNKRELKQISNKHLSDFDSKDFMNLYKKCIAKPYSFLVIDATLSERIF